VAVAFTELAAMSTSTSNTNQYTGTAGTPAAGDILIGLVGITANVTSGTMTGAWTWYTLKELSYNSGADSVHVFWAKATAATATTPVYTTASGNGSSCEIYVLRVTGSAGGGCPCIRQISTAIGTSANPAVVMFGAINTNNGCIGLIAENGDSSAVFTAPSSWAENAEAGTGTAPRHSTEVASRASGETGTSVAWTWTNTSSRPWGAIVMEFCLLGGRQMSPSGGGYSSPMFY